MEAFLRRTFVNLLAQTSLDNKRALYQHFQPSRLTGLIGPRGVGKTTLMLQYIKEHLAADNEAFYFAADSVYFQQASLLEFVDTLYHLEGYRFFFIDEVHQYDNWQQELKNLYDAFPDVSIVYSGSSMLELRKGSHDLSRRAKVYHLPGLSFREYLSFAHGLDWPALSVEDMLSDTNRINTFGQTPKLLSYFQAYLKQGYYPFVFEEPHTYQERLLRVIDKIIFEDIPHYYDLKTHNLTLFKRILSYLATIPPGEVNTNNIAKNMGVAHQTIFHYLTILESVGLVHLVYPIEGGNQYLRKPQKIFLHNTNLLIVLNQLVGAPIDKGTLRELYFVQALTDAQQTVYYSKLGDFQTEKAMFEIGGKNKTAQQLRGAQLPSYVVKDDVVVAGKNSKPLWACGLI